MTKNPKRFPEAVYSVYDGQRFFYFSTRAEACSKAKRVATRSGAVCPVYMNVLRDDVSGRNLVCAMLNGGTPWKQRDVQLYAIEPDRRRHRDT